MKRVASLLLLIIPFSTLPAAASPAVKAGQTCKKLGSKQISKGLTFTCIKSGKKLVWGRGVPVPTPINPVTPVAPVVPMTAVEKWRELNSGATKVWDQWKPSAELARPEARLLPISFTFHDLVPPNVRDETIRQYRISSAFWAQYLNYSFNTQVILSMYGNGRFVCEERGKALGQVVGPNYDCSNWTSSDFVAGSTPVSPRTGAEKLAGEMNWYVIGKFENFSDSNWRPRLHHEFMHTVAYSQNPDHWWTNACWFEEGWAEFFGVLLAAEGKEGDFYEMRHQTALRNSQFGLGRWSETSKTEDWAKWLADASVTKFSESSWSDGCGAFQRDGIYNSAILAVEYLVIKFGVPGVVAFQKDVASMGWTPSMEKLFGRSRAEAYLEIAEYMRKEYLLAAKNDYGK